MRWTSSSSGPRVDREGGLETKASSRDADGLHREVQEEQGLRPGVDSVRDRFRQEVWPRAAAVCHRLTCRLLGGRNVLINSFIHGRRRFFFKDRLRKREKSCFSFLEFFFLFFIKQKKKKEVLKKKQGK